MSEDTVRLDRILGGAEHAGEIGEVVASEEDEIDEIAKLQEAGVFELMLRQGFTVSQVVHDYGDVCQAITELAVELNAAISRTTVER